MTTDYNAITERQQATWATGDFNVISRLTMPMSEDLVRAVDPHAGQSVLDVACGTGNSALVAGRRHCRVAGIDYVPALIERARTRAKAEDMDIDFRVGDAQALPFPDASFDVVLSAIGVMFAPDQERAASELLRVCRPDGTIGLASWMPEGFGGEFFTAHARHVPLRPESSRPPAGAQRRAWQSLSAVAPDASRASGAPSLHTITLLTMPWKCTATTSARQSARSRRSMRLSRRASERTSRRCSHATTGRRMAPPLSSTSTS